MELKKIDFKGLNAKQKEIFNYQKVAGELADYGFNCIKLADDWQGADFLAYHKDGKGHPQGAVEVPARHRAQI